MKFRFSLPFLKKKSKSIEIKSEKKERDELNSHNLALYAHSLIERLSSGGGRRSFSKESRKCASNILSIFEENGVEGKLEEFSAFSSFGTLWMKVFPAVLPLSILIGAIGLPYISFLILGLCVLLSFSDLKRRSPLVKKLYKSAKGANVSAQIEALEEKEKRVVITAHHDSARIMKSGMKRDFIVLLSSFALVLLLSIFQMISEIFSSSLLMPNIPPLVFLILYIILLVLSFYTARCLFPYTEMVSPGSGDNLSGVAVILALSRYFSKNRTEHVALTFASFDGEEEAQQGSKAFFSSFSDRNSYVINIDGIFKKESLAVLTTDGYGFYSLDEALARKLAMAATAMGYRMKSGKSNILTGSTDALSAAENAFKAVTLTTIAEGKSVAHSEKDTPDAVEKEALEEVIAILIKFIESLDRKKEKALKEERRLFDENKRYRLSPVD